MIRIAIGCAVRQVELASARYVSDNTSGISKYSRTVVAVGRTQRSILILIYTSRHSTTAGDGWGNSEYPNMHVCDSTSYIRK